MKTILAVITGITVGIACEFISKAIGFQTTIGGSLVAASLASSLVTSLNKK